MPACGTVTISPAISGILLVVSPVSTRSFRLMVMVLPEITGAEALGLAAVPVVAVVTAAVASGAAMGGAEGGAVSLGSSRLGGSEVAAATPLLMACSGPMTGGSETSTYCAPAERVMITVSPASLAMPPASASSSSSVTWRSAWYTIE